MSIELGGKIRSIRFGMLAYENLLTTVAKEDGKVKSTAKVIYAGLLNASEVSDSTIDFTFNDIYGWIDELMCSPEGNKTILSIEKCFEESNMYQNILKPQIEKKSENAPQPLR
ncbi:MAG: hypothetical protein EOO20_18550 [Chryseobacterium sp.]|nr:MAG: hypothetical protein EOO20_18550 [Chryseobacterium sp.]